MTRQVRGSGESARPAWARRDLVAILVTVVALAACTGSGDDSSATFASTVQDGGHDATGSPSHVDADASDATTPDDATVDDAAVMPDAGVPAAMLSASALDLGAVGCSQSATQMLTVTNTGTGLLAVNGATTGVAFSVFPTSLSLEPGASGVLTITASIPGSASAGTPLGGSLELFTNNPAQPSVSIALTAKPTGATLTYSPTSPTNASFPSTDGDARVARHALSRQHRQRPGERLCRSAVRPGVLPRGIGHGGHSHDAGRRGRGRVERGLHSCCDDDHPVGDRVGDG